MLFYRTSTSFGTIEDLYISINHELEQFLKRFTQNDTDVTIDKLVRSNYNRGSSQKLQSEYTEVNFLGEELAPFFGHDGSILIHKNKKFVTSYQPAVKLRNTNMFLYCEQIREQHVNEILSPLLATIPIPPNSKFGNPVHHPAKNPHFLNLKNNNIDELHFILKNRQGENVRFTNSSQTIILLLLLRPTKRGVI